jgi:hypothetical protein
MNSDLNERKYFLNYVVRKLEAAVKFRRAFISVLKEVGVDSKFLIGNELEKEKYFLLVGDGKKILAEQNRVRVLKSHLIDIQQACLLYNEVPKSLTGLHNATARLLSQLFDAADGFHSFFGNPLDEHYGFHYLKLGWNRLEVFDAEYSILREVLKDLIDPIVYRENFENIENLSIL